MLQLLDMIYVEAVAILFNAIYKLFQINTANGVIDYLPISLILQIYFLYFCNWAQLF